MGHPFDIVRIEGREVVCEISTSLHKGQYTKFGHGEGRGPKTGKKFGHDLWMVPIQNYCIHRPTNIM